jgi:hypothetical protein
MGNKKIVSKMNERNGVAAVESKQHRSQSVNMIFHLLLVLAIVTLTIAKKFDPIQTKVRILQRNLFTNF